jgi:hypothetical protein
VRGGGARGWARRAGFAALVGLGVAGPLVLRAAWEGRAELVHADAAGLAGRVDLEVVHLGRAARWRAPLARHDDEALTRLMAIGARAEGEGGAGSQTALLAYREARAAILATRAWGVADARLLYAANRRIAALMADQEKTFGTDLSQVGAAVAYHWALLEQTCPKGHPWPAIAAALGGIAAAWAVAVGLPTRGAVRRRPLIAGAAVAATLWAAAWLLR